LLLSGKRFKDFNAIVLGVLLVYVDRSDIQRLNTRLMKIKSLLPLTILSTMFLTACAGDMPKLFWSADEGSDQPAYAQGGKQGASASSRVPLDVPPELRAELSVPSADSIAPVSDNKALPEAYQKSVAGKYVALDAKLYEATAGQVFSSAIDAMTSMNLPVQSVDSPSGTLTTDWIRKGAGKADAMAMFTNMFNLGSGRAIVRYRYVVRVLRATVEGREQTRLEIRTIGQVYRNGQWANAQLKRKVADELFIAVEEHLARVQAQAPKSAAALASAPETTPAIVKPAEVTAPHEIPNNE